VCCAALVVLLMLLTAEALSWLADGSSPLEDCRETAGPTRTTATKKLSYLRFVRVARLAVAVAVCVLLV
jgi:hypothetical protein